MEPIAIILVVVSSFMHALRDFFTKKSIDKESFSMMFQWAGLVYFLPLFLFILLKENIPLATTITPPIIASILIHIVYWIFLSKALSHGDLSHVYPIIRSSPAFVLIGSFMLLDETVSWIGFIGIMLIVIGVYVINTKELTVREFKNTITSIIHEKAARYAFLTLLCVTSYSLIDKIGVQKTHPIIFIYILALGIQCGFTPFVLTTRKWVTVLKEWQTNKVSILINGFLVTTGYVLILYAFTLEKVSYVVGFRQLSVVFAVLLGKIVLKEQKGALRLIAACIIFIGSAFITIAE